MNKTFKMLRSLLKADRSVRRFQRSVKISAKELAEIVELVRYCPSGRNLQALRYRIVTQEEECNQIYPALKWAGYFPDWNGPAPFERPVAYLVQCLDTRLTKDCLCDDGLQLETITLGATAQGYGCCIIKSFNMEMVRNALHLEDRMKPLYIIALGRPAETIELEDTDGTSEADIKYYRTPDGVHHVPKRPLAELLINKPDSIN